MSSGDRKDPSTVLDDEDEVLDGTDDGDDDVDLSDFLEDGPADPEKKKASVLAMDFAAARAGDKISIGKTEVEFAAAPSGSIKPAKVTFEDGSTLAIKYGASGSVIELELKDPSNKIKEKLTSENGKDFTHEIAGQPAQPFTGTIEHDGVGSFTARKRGAVESTRAFLTDGSIVAKNPKPGSAEESTTNLDGSVLRRSTRSDGSSLETSFKPGTPPVPAESRLIDDKGVVRQVISFDAASKPSKITLFEGIDPAKATAVIEPTGTPGSWRRTEGSGDSAKTQTGKVEITSEGKVLFTADKTGDQTKPSDQVKVDDRPQVKDAPSAPVKIEKQDIGRATVELEVRGDQKQPRLVQYDSMNKVEFVRADGKLKEVKVTQNGKDAVWESTDGINFKLKGATPEVTAKITYENGKVTIEATVGGKPERTEFHPDGSTLKRTVDEKNNVWSRVRAADGSMTEEITMDDKRKVTRKYDRDGAKQVTIAGADGKLQLAYTKVPGSDNWVKYDLSEKPPKPVAGRLSMDSVTPEPKFTRLDASDRIEGVDAAEQRKINLEALQNTLIGAFPATSEGNQTKIQREYERKFTDEMVKLKLPESQAVWTQEHRKQIEDLRNKIQQEQNQAIEAERAQVKARIEAIEAERQRGEFGPATKKMYQEYVDWLQTTSLPAYLKMHSQMMTTLPPDSPRKLPAFAIPGMPNLPPDYMSPATFRAQAGREGLPPIDLGIDTSSNEPPKFEDLQKLGKAMLWMKESQEAIEENRRHYEVTKLIPDAIQKNGLPEGWDYKNYPGRDRDAYRAAYHRTSDIALRTRNLIVTAVDSDKLNLAQSQNWFRRDVAEVRKDLEIPPEWKIEIDPTTKKITKLDLDLPETLDPNDPVVKEKLARLEAWLNGPGKKIEKAVEDAMAKEKDPSKFLFWGTSEMPKGYKFQGADGTEVAANVLQCDFTVAKRDGKIVVNYTIQPQNAHVLSYQNLPAFCMDAGKPFVEERTYDPEDFVMVRHGMEGVQMVKAKDLDSWMTWEKVKYRTEKGLVAAMDIGMIATGTIELRAASAAAKVTAKEAIKLTARELMVSRALGWYRIGLGATGVFNNAGMRQWSPGGYNVGQWFLDARGLAFVADVTMHLPGQIKTLAGVGKGLEVGSRAWKMEEAAKTLSTFTKFVDGANKIQMTIANFGFAPMIFGDIRHQILRPEMQTDLDGLRDSNAIINGLGKQPNEAAAAEKRLFAYADHLDMPPAQSQEANKIIGDTTAVLKKPASPQRETEMQAAKEKLVEQIKTNKDKNVQLVAAAALLALCRNEKGQIPAGDALVNKNGAPLFKKEELDAVLSDEAANLAGRQLLASELKVQLGTLSPADYGKQIKEIVDNKSLPQADKSKQWAMARTEFLDKLLQVTYAGASPQMELEMSRKVLEAYEKQLGESADPATKAELKKILDETKRLLELKDKDPEAFKKDVEIFKKQLMAYFRNDEGAKVAEIERRRSNVAGSLERINDEQFRTADIAARGPKDVNRNLQVAAAAALLLLNRDKTGKLDGAAVAAGRQIDVPAFKYTKVTYEESGTGATKKYTRKTSEEEAPARKMDQTISVNDLIAIVQADATSRQSGSRRLVSADTLFHAGKMPAESYASVLKDTLNPPKGMAAPSAVDRQWALERIGFLANAQRAQEGIQKQTLDSTGQQDAAGMAFGVSSADLKAAILSAAKNPNETADNRARAAYILRALDEKPDECQRMLQEIVGQTKDKDYAKIVTAKLEEELKHPNVDNRFKAANALDSFGKIGKAEYNEIMMQCVDSANPDLRAKAIKALKADAPEDLTADQRQKLFNILGQAPTDLHQPAQLALLERINKITPAADIKDLTDKIGSFVNPESKRYADKSTDLRVAAIKALGEFNQTGTAPWVQKCLDDQSAKVRIAAMNALGRMNPPELWKLLDARREKENDFAARQVLDDLRFSVPRETDAAAYKKQWEKLIADMPQVWFKKGTSGTLEGVTKYIEGKFGKEHDPINNEDQILLLKFESIIKNKWADHNNALYIGRMGRGLSKIGRGIGYVFTLGNVEVNPYSKEAAERFSNDWHNTGQGQLDKIVEEAKGDSPDQAIATMGYITRNNGSPIDDWMRQRAQNDFSRALIDIAKSAKPGADLAMREIVSGLTDQDIDVNVRQRYLNAIVEIRNAGKLTKEQAAHIIFQAMHAELVRTKSQEPPEGERAAAVKFWDACLSHITALNPVGYLGPHYDAGAQPLLKFMAYNHPFKEIRERATMIIGRMEDSGIDRYLATKPEAGLKPEDAARRINAALADVTKNPDRVIDEIARCSGNPPITSPDDPRIKALQSALKVPSEKVKMAAGFVLTGYGNTGVTEEAKRDCVKAMAQVHAAGVYLDKETWVRESRNIVDGITNYANGDKTIGELYQNTMRDELERLRNTSPRKAGEELATKMDGSVLKYNAKGQIENVQFPQRDMKVTGINLRWDDANQVKSIQFQDGKTWTREYKEGKPTQVWMCDGKEIFRGDVQVKPDGTIILDKVKVTIKGTVDHDKKEVREEVTSRPESREVLRTDGSKFSTQFNDKGKPSKVTMPDGGVIEYTYDDSGNLTQYKFDGRATEVKNGLVISPTRNWFAEVKVGPNGELIHIANDGMRGTWHPEGYGTHVYEGPPAQVTNAAKDLKALYGNNLTADQIAERMKSIMEASGPIQDKLDPRIALLREAMQSPNSKVADTAEQLLKHKYNRDIEPGGKPNWDFNDKNTPLAEKLALAKRALSDRSRGDADPSRRTAAVEFLATVCRDHTLSESDRMEAINFLLKNGSVSGDGDKRYRTAAIETMVTLATGGKEQKDNALQLLKALDPASKSEALQYLSQATEYQLRGSNKPGKEELENRLALIVEQYTVSKGDLPSEANLWRMTTALAGHLDGDKFTQATALIDRRGSAHFKPIADQNDPRLPYMKRALESSDELLKLSAALALTDKANTKDAVDKNATKEAFEQVLYKQIEKLIQAASKLEKSEDKKAKSDAWAAVEALYARLGSDPEGLPYTYATMKRIEALHGPQHKDLLPLYDRLVKHFTDGKDPMQAEEYKRRAAVIRGEVAKPATDDLTAKLEALRKQLSTADARAARAHIADIETIAKGLEGTAGKGTKATGDAYRVLGDAYAKAGEKDKAAAAYEQAAKSLEQAKDPATMDVLGVLAKHYATEKNPANFKATKDKILQVSRWRGTQEANIQSADRLMELAEYLTSENSNQNMQTEAEDLLTRAVAMGKEAGEGSPQHMTAMDAMADFYRHPNIAKNGKAAEILTTSLNMRRTQNGGMLPPDAAERARDLAELQARLGSHNSSVDLMEEILRNPASPPAVAAATRQQYATMLKHYGYNDEATMVANGGLPAMTPNIPGPDAQGQGRYRGGGGPGGLTPGSGTPAGGNPGFP